MILVDHIFRQIEQLGYLVAELRQDGHRVLIAEPMVNIDPDKRGPDRFRQMVRIDGVNETSRNQAARQLALQCGIIINDSGE